MTNYKKRPNGVGANELHKIFECGNNQDVALALAAVFKDIPPWTPPLFYSWSHKEQTRTAVINRLFHAYARWKGDPTHANKRGVRYRYYVSHAILQNCKAEAGSIGRLPAPEIESLVCDSVRSHLAAMVKWSLPPPWRTAS